jgi:hypothetical protein
MPYRYSEVRRPRTPWQWVVCRWRIRRAKRRRDMPDGRDYTGWRATVVSLPRPGMSPGVGAQGVVTGRDGELHEIELPGSTWTLPLPSRHLQLIPPAES